MVNIVLHNMVIILNLLIMRVYKIINQLRMATSYRIVKTVDIQIHNIIHVMKLKTHHLLQIHQIIGEMIINNKLFQNPKHQMVGIQNPNLMKEIYIVLQCIDHLNQHSQMIKRMIVHGENKFYLNYIKLY
jgi:hypothetical protein